MPHFLTNFSGPDNLWCTFWLHEFPHFHWHSRDGLSVSPFQQLRCLTAQWRVSFWVSCLRESTNHSLPGRGQSLLPGSDQSLPAWKEGKGQWHLYFLWRLFEEVGDKCSFNGCSTNRDVYDYHTNLTLLYLMNKELKNWLLKVYLGQSSWTHFNAKTLIPRVEM